MTPTGPDATGLTDLAGLTRRADPAGLTRRAELCGLVGMRSDNSRFAEVGPLA